ncbi:hypothetical protein PCANC_27686 [Puccinia coronata f. sp. avenae]|uniref:Uncharacterized protein n=1 Tax=Puccinia coronata f. sp. avenae TaxID=200324 RepID=A0A2N5TK34_9BASI|nr:hypothetical protein PCANC_27686 [Puccinia coronata f. sp. avenae]
MAPVDRCHCITGPDSGTPFGRAHAYPHAQKKWRAAAARRFGKACRGCTPLWKGVQGLHAALERRAGAARLSPHAARHVHAYNRRAGVQSLHACLKGVQSLHALRTGVQALHAWYPYKGTQGTQGTLIRVPLGTLIRVPSGTLIKGTLGTLIRVPNGTLIRVPNGTLIRVPNGTLIRVPLGTLIRVPSGTLIRVPGTLIRVPWVPL